MRRSLPILFSLFALVAIVAAACSSDGGDDGAPITTSPPPSDSGDTGTPPPADALAATITDTWNASVDASPNGDLIREDPFR